MTDAMPSSGTRLDSSIFHAAPPRRQNSRVLQVCRLLDRYRGAGRYILQQVAVAMHAERWDLVVELPMMRCVTVTGRGGSSPGMTRTCDMMVNSHPLYQLSYRGSGLGVRPPTPALVPHPGTRVKSVPGCPGTGRAVDGGAGGG